MYVCRPGRSIGQLLVALVCAACSGACASSGGAVPRPFPMPGGTASNRTPDHAPGPVPSAVPFPPAPPTGPFDGYALAGTALGLRGAPYRSGGSDPQGFDCSGFTQYVFAQYGVSLPRDVRAQFHSGKPVEADEVAAGDILFFTTTDPGPSHVGIAIGGDEFVHAPSASGVVRVEHLSSSYWSPRYLGARRVN